MVSRRSGRLAAISERVIDAEKRLSRRHPDVAHAVHHSFRRLHVGLDDAHRDHCESVDDARWASYADDLDRGLGELEVEMARAAAAGQQSIAEVTDMLVMRTSALELSGWRLRYTSAHGHAPSEKFGESLATAEAMVADRRGDTDGPGRRSTDEVMAAVDDVRRAASNQSAPR